jgi:hypothetical protein
MTELCLMCEEESKYFMYPSPCKTDEVIDVWRAQSLVSRAQEEKQKFIIHLASQSKK